MVQRSLYDCSGAPNWRERFSEICKLLGHQMVWERLRFNPCLTNSRLPRRIILVPREDGKGPYKSMPHMSKISKLGWSFVASNHVVSFSLTLAWIIDSFHNGFSNPGQMIGCEVLGSLVSITLKSYFGGGEPIGGNLAWHPFLQRDT
ncbi:hypothetical protein Tco_1164073 [Tanacetum coccineum]